MTRVAPTDTELVFVVDDDSGMRETLIDLLGDVGITATGAASIKSARDEIPRLHPSLIVVDQRLPDGSGINLSQELKAQEPDRPVLLLTGYATVETAISAVGTVDDYLVKPIHPEQLVKVVRDNLDKARIRSENRQLLVELRRANGALQKSMFERTTELAGLVSIAESTSQATGLAGTVDASLETACRVSASVGAALYLVDSETGIAHRVAQYGESWSMPDDLPPSLSIESDDAEAEGPVKILSLECGDERLGTILLQRPDLSNPTFLRTLSTQIALAIQNAQRFELERETVSRISELAAMKDMFVATASHELRTPLTSVLGFTRVLLNDNQSMSSDERREMLEIISEQGNRLSRLVEDILDVSRLESNQIAVDHDIISVNMVIRASVLSAQEDHKIVIDVPDDVPDIYADSHRVQQVIGNLVQNARKFSSDGSTITLRAAAEPTMVAIAVIDEGIGINPGFVPHLFNSFTQADQSSTRRESGLGLGLYIAKGLVDAMNGTITVNSKLGLGTEFIVRLPRA